LPLNTDRLCYHWLVGTLEWNFRIIQITVAYFMLAGFLTSLDRVERERLKNDQDKKNRLAMWYLMMTQRQGSPKPAAPRPVSRPWAGPPLDSGGAESIHSSNHSGALSCETFPSIC
jgi:hypothetical protein